MFYNDVKARMPQAEYDQPLVWVAVLLLGAVPTWPYSRAWGYYPSGLLGLVLLIVIILVLLERIWE